MREASQTQNRREADFDCGPNWRCFPWLKRKKVSLPVRPSWKVLSAFSAAAVLPHAREIVHSQAMSGKERDCCRQEWWACGISHAVEGQ